MYFQQGENAVYQHFLPQILLWTSAGPCPSPKIAVQRHISHVQPGKAVHLQMDQCRDEGEDSSQLINSESTMGLEKKNTDPGVTAAHPCCQPLPFQALTGMKTSPKSFFFLWKSISNLTAHHESAILGSPRPLRLPPLGEVTSSPVSDE